MAVTSRGQHLGQPPALPPSLRGLHHLDKALAGVVFTTSGTRTDPTILPLQMAWILVHGKPFLECLVLCLRVRQDLPRSQQEEGQHNSHCDPLHVCSTLWHSWGSHICCPTWGSAALVNSFSVAGRLVSVTPPTPAGLVWQQPQMTCDEQPRPYKGRWQVQSELLTSPLKFKLSHWVSHGSAGPGLTEPSGQWPDSFP